MTRLSEAGYPASFLERDAAAALEPDLRVSPDALVGWFPGEAHCYPEVPMASGPAVVGVLARTAPVPVRLSRVVTTDTLNVRPAGGGALLAHALDQDQHAVPGSPVPAEVLATLHARIADLVGCPVTLTSAVVGQRALPADGLPIVGPLGDRGYVVVTHSGVTLAPLLGELVAREVCTGEEEPRLAPYRLDRFTRAYSPARPARTPASSEAASVRQTGECLRSCRYSCNGGLLSCDGRGVSTGQRPLSMPAPHG